MGGASLVSPRPPSPTSRACVTHLRCSRAPSTFSSQMMRPGTPRVQTVPRQQEKERARQQPVALSGRTNGFMTTAAAAANLRYNAWLQQTLTFQTTHMDRANKTAPQSLAVAHSQKSESRRHTNRGGTIKTSLCSQTLD